MTDEPEEGMRFSFGYRLNSAANPCAATARTVLPILVQVIQQSEYQQRVEVGEGQFGGGLFAGAARQSPAAAGIHPGRSQRSVRWPVAVESAGGEGAGWMSRGG